MKQLDSNFLFIGYKHPYGNQKFGKNLDVYIFVDALSNITGNNVNEYFLEEKDNDTAAIVDFCKKINPDYIFFNLINNELPIECLEKLKKSYTTINWFGDDQWRFDSFSSKMSEYFTYSVTTDKYSIFKYNALGRNVILSQWAAINFKSPKLKFENIEYKYEVTFIGGYSYTREWLIEYLRKNDIEVNVFGNGWNEQVGFLDYSEVSKLFSTSKINLNLSNSVPKDINFFVFFFKNWINKIFSFKDLIKFIKAIKFFFFYNKSSEQIKARNFEIPISGGFQISNYSLSLEDYLKIGEEVITFNSKEELLTLVKYYLENDLKRNLIRDKSYKNSKNNTYEKRLLNILKQIK